MAIITSEQKKIVETLCDSGSKEFGALMAFGGQMYRNGYVRGAVEMAVGLILGGAIYFVGKTANEWQHESKANNEKMKMSEEESE